MNMRPHLITTADDFANIKKAVAIHFNNPYPQFILKPLTIDEWVVCRPSDGEPHGSFNHFYVVRQGTRYRFERRITKDHPHYPKPFRSADHGAA